MTARSPLFGRRIHIAGSVEGNGVPAPDVDAARQLIAGLVPRLVRAGANFVTPVDTERLRGDGLPVCFDWLVWQSIHDSMALRPPDAPGPMVVAVIHNKTEDQIPNHLVALWDKMRASPDVRIESAAAWDMNAVRMANQARYGDVLVTLGGGEGVCYLANLYHDAGKPVVPLNLPICSEGKGARRLHEFGLAGANARRMFRMTSGEEPHSWLNLLRFPARQAISDRVDVLMRLLERLERPTAFAVRLLNDAHPAYEEVQNFFDSVVKPVVEDDFGYRLAVIDGRHAHEHARIDQEIFAKLYRSAMVIADITGSRPNCFLELGYALGRPLPTVVTLRAGEEPPFDITTFGGHRWTASGAIEGRRRALRDHINAVRRRPPLVDAEPLIG